jgi:tetratricopeptide (TPR) repeat protein
MHARREWLISLPRNLVWQTLFVFPLAALVAFAQPPTAPSSDLTSLREIEQEEFEPAIGEQIRRSYQETVQKPTDAEVVGRLGMILHCYRKYELAEICYRRAWTLLPRSFRWTYYLGTVEGELGKNRLAVNHVREALKIDENYTPAHIHLGQLLFESGDLQESMREYEESIRQNPRIAGAYLGRGRIFAAGGNWSSAIESFRTACALFQGYAAAHYALAMVYAKIGDRAKALEQLEIYQRFKKVPPPTEDKLMDAVNSLYVGGNTRFEIAISLAQQGKTEQASIEFESALKANPHLMMAHVNLIAIYGTLGQSDKAEEHFREAIGLDPGWAELYYNWGLLLYRERRPLEAEETFRRAIEINPHYANAHVELGQLLDESGRTREAQQHFRLALEDAPYNRQAHYLLGCSLIHTDQFEDAITQLLETIRVDDDKTPFCLQALATAYRSSGDVQKALQYAEQARERAALLKMKELVDQLQKDIDQLSGETKTQ